MVYNGKKPCQYYAIPCLLVVSFCLVIHTLLFAPFEFVPVFSLKLFRTQSVLGETFRVLLSG